MDATNDSFAHLPSIEARLQRQLTVRVGHRIVHYFVGGYHHFHALNPCPLPATGPAILVSNHISGLDPVLLQSTTPRLITWMMAREYYEMTGFQWFYRAIGAIPVDRSGRDLASTRSALRALEEGRVLGIFAEGKISYEQKILPFQTGIGLLAQRSGAPVYPACLEGTVRGQDMLQAFLHPQRVCAAFGSPLQFNAKTPPATLPEITQTIQSKVVTIHQQVRAAVGGCRNHEA